MQVTATFDPCALDSHDWRPATFGIAQLVGADVCVKCGKSRLPPCEGVGGIDPSPRYDWRQYAEA
jgi:hypothetical protein